MWRRWLADLRVRLYWLKKDLLRHWQLDTPTGVVGILTVIFGLTLFVSLAQGLAKMFRLFIPWVTGANISEAYWSSVGFAIKTSFVFLAFCVLVLLLFVLKFSKRR